MKKEKSIQNLMLVAYFIFNIYYLYRYLFKYNSETTSPTYSETPPQLQMAKYIIAIGIFFVLLILLYIHNIKITFKTPELIIILCMVFCFFKSIQQSSFDYFIKYYLCLMVAYGFIFINDNNFVKRFIAVNKLIFFYHVIYSCLQILLYLSVGRLPALGYENSLVRFGGGWDDPNGFALYLVIPYCYILSLILTAKSSKKIFRLYFLLTVCIILELLTFSFTGYLSFVIASVCIMIKYRRSKKLPKMIFVALVLAISVFIVAFDTIIKLFDIKMGSLLIHFESINLKIENGLMGALIGDGSYEFFENHFKILIYNFGLPYLIVNSCIGIYFIVISYRLQKYHKNNHLYFVNSVYILIYTIVQFSLPFSIIFPVNFIYWTSAFMTLKNYRNIMGIKSVELKHKAIVRNVAC